MMRISATARASLGVSTSLLLVLLPACGSDSSSGNNAGGPASSGAGTSSGGSSSTSGASGSATSAGTNSGGASQGGGGSSGGTNGSGGSAAGAAGSAGASGTSNVACHDEGASGPLTTRLPCVLSETGLYAADMTTLAAGVHPFAPNFQLWTDSAAKKRWIALPVGTKIDTSDMDYWSFPTGTKLWKEFARDGVRVETRLLEKQASGSWYAVAYQWRADQLDADAVPNGVMNASGTQHDIPNNDQCFTCHSQTPDKALGFSALQLSHDKLSADASEWTLDTLMKDGLLTQPPAATFSVPGTDVERKFFGYLHGNCSHCHNPKGTMNDQTGLDMFLKVSELSGPPSSFAAYKALRDMDIVWLDGMHPDAPKRVASGSLTDSAVYQRFITKGKEWSMPPLGTEVVDPAGKQAIEDFINSLK